MGVLPVPEEVREMARNIGGIVSAIETLNKRVDKVQSQINELRMGLDNVNVLNDKLEGMQGTLTTMKDAMRMLTTTMERKL